jgi:HEAT repeat protein
MHPTFREYLAAQAVERRLRHSANDYQTVIGDNVKNENWASVLLSLSLMHQNPEALIRWMTGMALDKFYSGAALLAHRCWEDAEKSLRKNLSPDIIRALAGGLGDLQSGLATEARLREHLIDFGDDATDRIVALINDFSGLQKQLLPEWKGNRHPDMNTEAGHRIYSGFKARYHLIDVLGDIGNPAAVDPLISWLNEQDLNDSYRQDIAHHARKTLKCIGIPAVGPLLNRIGDVNLGNQARTDSLHALNVVGIRTAFVAPVIEACLTEGLQGNPSLLAAALRSATRLRDREHCPAAIVALNSQEKEVVAEAANYFARRPDASAEDALHNAFAKWRSMADGSFNVNWTLKKLAAALGAVGTLKSTETVSNLIVLGLLGQGELTDADAVELANEVRLPNFPTHLLDELIRKVDAGESGHALDRIVMQISERWRPHETSQLARAVESLQRAIDSQSLSQKLLDTYLLEEAKNPTEPYRRVNGEPLLRLLAKCEVTDFAEQAVRLLPGAEFWLVSQVADALWVVGDKSAERPLIQALSDFERPSMQRDRPMPEEFDIIRALGTCASKRGAENIIDYINANPDLSIYVPEEVLCPLVSRGVLDIKQLAEMAVDNAGTHEYVRRACVLALGYLDTEAFAPVFLKSLATESDELTKGHAAFFLGWAKSDRPSALEALKDLLTKAEKPYLAEQAAKSLVRLEDRSSLPSIEKTIERFGTAGSTSGLLRAAARFHASSTLQLLEKIHSDKLGSYFQTEGEMIAAFGEFYHEDQDARAVVDAALENSSYGFAARTQQVAVSILASRNPNGLLQRAATLYDEALLDPGACGTLVNRISQLSEAKDIDTKWLIEVLKRFLCDQSLSIREASSAALQLADPSVRTSLYEQLEATANEWARACTVYSLGFWDSDERVIESARFDSSPLVRRFASIASVNHQAQSQGNR